MAKVYLICGKLCCGKTTYSQKLCSENNAVLLSVDEMTLTVFVQSCGEKHDEYVINAKTYLLNKSLELIDKNINVVLDWGFWTRKEREFTKEFYKSHGIDCEFHYIDISDETWKARIEQRNQTVHTDKTSAYYVDESLLAKFNSIFETPSEDEIAVVYQGDINGVR